MEINTVQKPSQGYRVGNKKGRMIDTASAGAGSAVQVSAPRGITLLAG